MTRIEDRYPVRHGIVWISGEPYTATDAETFAANFLDSAINAPGEHWRAGWGEQLEDLCRAIREAKVQEQAKPVSLTIGRAA